MENTPQSELRRRSCALHKGALWHDVPIMRKGRTIRLKPLPALTSDHLPASPAHRSSL